MKMKKVTFITKQNPTFRETRFMEATENHRLMAARKHWKVETVKPYTR